MKYKLRNNKRGSSLVELIVVLTILAVLAADADTRPAGIY